MKPQILVVYFHEDKRLFFVSSINSDRIDIEGRVDKQYSRARSLHRGIIEGTVAEHGSGFLYAIINTNYQGWDIVIDPTIRDNQEDNLKAKQQTIDSWLNSIWTNVGSNSARAKGEYGNGKTEYKWNKKFNVGRMTRDDIFEKINMVMKGSDLEINNSIRNSVYYAIALPDSHGPRSKNFGNYQVDSLSNIFLFTRQLCGLDLV